MPARDIIEGTLAGGVILSGARSAGVGASHGMGCTIESVSFDRGRD
jgi:hypothetical protein